MKNYDVIIIGAGSIGLPTAYYLSKNNFKVAVIEKEPSPGRGQNRAAIGGIRATHSIFSKINLCKRSIKIFSSWEQLTGFDINWQQGGYLYPIYNETDKKNVLELLKIQKSYGLNIDWITKEEVKEIINGIDDNNLLGGIFSPEDGNASPLKASYSFYLLSKQQKVDFFFNETVIEILLNNNDEIIGLKTNKNKFYSKFVINSAGVDINKVNSKLNIKIPLKPDCHEAGIFEPVKKFFEPMVVDIRKYKNSKNIYFYQNKDGQIVFALSPSPEIYCSDDNISTFEFLNLFAQRAVKLLPKLGELRIRRLWRGYYPNTPDGAPIIDLINNSYIIAGGMCGQGFMLGPGVATLILNIISQQLTEEDKKILDELSLNRNFDSIEFYK